MRRLPPEGVAGAGAGGGLVHREHRAERAEVLLWYGLHWQIQSPAGDGCDVAADASQGRPPGATSRTVVPSMAATTCSASSKRTLSSTRMTPLGAAPLTPAPRS